MIKKIKHWFGIHDWGLASEMSGCEHRICDVCGMIEIRMADMSWHRALGAEEKLAAMRSLKNL